MYDLETTAFPVKTKDYTELDSRVRKSFQIEESLKLSQQLYVMSSKMEVYFAQNQDAEYLNAIERDVLALY